MKSHWKIFIAILLVTIITGCKKEKEQLSRHELLTRQAWIQTSATAVRQSDGVSTDVYAGLMDCKKDDTFVFAADNSFQQTEGASKCSPADPQVFFTGNWAFAGDETLIAVSAPGAGSGIFSILELTGTTLRLQITQGGYISTATYRH